MSEVNLESSDKKFDFILMDFDMPVMNGFEAKKVIKRYISKGVL